MLTKLLWAKRSPAAKELKRREHTHTREDNRLLLTKAKTTPTRQD